MHDFQACNDLAERCTHPGRVIIPRTFNRPYHDLIGIDLGVLFKSIPLYKVLSICYLSCSTSSSHRWCSVDVILAVGKQNSVYLMRGPRPFLKCSHRTPSESYATTEKPTFDIDMSKSIPKVNSDAQRRH